MVNGLVYKFKKLFRPQKAKKSSVRISPNFAAGYVAGFFESILAG